MRPSGQRKNYLKLFFKNKTKTKAMTYSLIYYEVSFELRHLLNSFRNLDRLALCVSRRDSSSDSTNFLYQFCFQFLCSIARLKFSFNIPPPPTWPQPCSVTFLFRTRSVLHLSSLFSRYVLFRHDWSQVKFHQKHTLPFSCL